LLVICPGFGHHALLLFGVRRLEPVEAAQIGK
jgi:hypothetical protein